MQTGLPLKRAASTSSSSISSSSANPPNSRLRPLPQNPWVNTRPSQPLHIHIFLAGEEGSNKRKKRPSGRFRMASSSAVCVDSTASTVPAMPPVSDKSKKSAHAPKSSASSASSTISETDQEQDRKSRADRPRLASRKPSASILVPRDHPEIEIEEEEFPPDDARAMSPRRNSADVLRLGKEARETLQQHAKTLQSSLQAVVEQIEEAATDAGKLETENQFLQDYIGDLTRTMATSADLTSTTGSGKGKRAQK